MESTPMVVIRIFPPDDAMAGKEQMRRWVSDVVTALSYLTPIDPHRVMVYEVREPAPLVDGEGAKVEQADG